MVLPLQEWEATRIRRTQVSYARHGDDSDVYVWADNTQIWVSIRGDLKKKVASMPVGADLVGHHRAGTTLAFIQRSEAYAMLGALASEGVNVPGYVFTRLYDEMEDLGDHVGIKRMAKYTTTRVMSPF